MTKVLVLTRYDRLGASSRVCILQFLPMLEQGSIEFDLHSLLDADYLRARYRYDRVKLMRLLRSYLRRMWELLRRRQYDLIWLEKEAFPWLPTWFESLLFRGVPYVVDLDDAWYLRYEENRWPFVRFFLGAKIDKVMRNAAVVIAGNRNIAERARKAGAIRVEVIPTTINLWRDQPSASVGRSETRDPKRIMIDWIGTPFTVAYLLQFEPAFRAAANEIECLHLIGADAPALFSGLPTNSFPWSEATEIQHIKGVDVGVMPLIDRDWEQGKCAYKLLQFMAAEIPVIASPVGANCDVVRDGVNGLLASTTEEWVVAVRRLTADPSLRARLGAEGRRTVERDDSVERIAPRLSSIIRDAARSRRLGSIPTARL